MGCWDEFCVVCGGPPYNPDPELDVFREDEDPKDVAETEGKVSPRALNFQDFEWLKSYVGINEAEELIPLGDYSDYGSFDLFADGATGFDCATTVQCSNDVEPNLYGLACHEKCYRVLERDVQYTLRFHDVWPMLMAQQDLGGLLQDYTDYGGMKAYQSQYFLFEKLFSDGKEWMLQDPMTHLENAERISKVWRPILESGFKVIKTDQPGREAEGVDNNQTASQVGLES